MGSRVGTVARLVLPLLAAALWLAACAQDRQQARMAELRRQVEAEKQDCANLYPRDVAGPEHYSQRVRCLNEVEARFMRPIEPFPDLTDQRLAARKALAADLDAGRPTETDAHVPLAQKKAQVEGEERRRTHATRSISAGATAAKPHARLAVRRNCR